MSWWEGNGCPKCTSGKLRGQKGTWIEGGRVDDYIYCIQCGFRFDAAMPIEQVMALVERYRCSSKPAVLENNDTDEQEDDDAD